MNTKTKQLKLLLVIILSVVVFSSCSVTKGKGIAERAVIQFHNQFNAGQYHEIYVQSDDAFRQAGPESQMVTLLEAIRKKLGIVKNSKQVGWHVNATTGGTLVNLAYEVEFAEGSGTEQFVFHITGDQALLYNYNINSPLLIIK